MTAPDKKPSDKKSYKETLNLPQTTFAMEAKLVTHEPARLKKWQEAGLYEQIQTARAGRPRWILHDGPPFANGDIHIGHVLNKTLKDVIVRFRSMQGYDSPYVPGWDCHGLPIEQKIQDEVGPKLREMSPLEVRKLCFAHADKYVALQSQQFQRLGVSGDWHKPYLTMSPAYEAATLEVFAKFVEAELVERKLKPVYWSIANRTALADADIEYRDIEGPSIYVEFRAAADEAVKKLFSSKLPEPVYFLVWTTTPWTLPANLAVAVHPEMAYALVRYQRAGQTRLGVVAEPLLEQVFGRKAVDSYEKLAAVSGAALAEAKLTYHHPLAARPEALPMVTARYVTTTDGTGLVHTAPGHGIDDYATGLANKLQVYSPVRDDGKFDDTVPQWLRGIRVFDADAIIVKHLQEQGTLFDQGRITHSYPHDERSKTPVIFRATEQWFIMVDKPYQASDEKQQGASLRQRATEACGGAVRFVPHWGQARMNGMLQSRPDWCISRQRAWGLPIPVFYNEQGQCMLTPQSIRAVARCFAAKGSDAWYTLSPAELLGADFRYPSGFKPEGLRKEKDIFDVWFESGSSWHAVLQGRTNLEFPAQMYLEGSDQHRGWFQLSMLAALGATGRAPFAQVLTHGFIVGPDGKKKSKRDKEYVTATQEIDRHGADLLRLWCCSVDYQGDVPVSPQMLKDFGDKYVKIRNTMRYLLSNLYDFDPARHAQEIPLNSLDGWVSAELDNLIVEVKAAYDTYQLHRAFRLLHDFCAVQLSSVYAKAMKDRLYCELPDAPLRRRSQMVMHRLVLALAKLLAPMIAFTADEVWEFIPHKPAEDAKLSSVHLALMPEPSGLAVPDERREEWKLIKELCDQALLQLDAMKKESGLNKASDAEVIYEVDDDDLRRRLQAYGADLEDIVGAGCHSFAEKPSGHPAVTVRVVDRRTTYQACARSWKRRPDVGSDPEYPDLCLRCAAAVRTLGK